MNGKLLCMLCIIYCMQADENNHPNIEKLIKKQNHQLKGQQEIRITENTDLSACSVPELIQYMMWISADQVRSTFVDMPLQAKRVFLKQMNIKQYGWFLFAFSGEQWHHMWKKLPKNQQKTIPPTKLEQLKMIRDVWLACSSGTISYYACAKGNEHAKDLPLWRDRALKTIEHLKVHHPNRVELEERERIFYKWLDNQFQAKKLKLLKEFSS